MVQGLWQIPVLFLSFEHFLGGQARLTSKLTPVLYERAMSKAAGTAEALYPIIPVKDPVLHSNVIGLLMVSTGSLLAYSKTRGSNVTLSLNTFLTLAGIYSQRRMRIPYYVPVFNLLLGAAVYYLERAREPL